MDSSFPPLSSTPNPNPAPSSKQNWTSILQSKPAPKPPTPNPPELFNTAKSSANSKGISVAVVDANAIIHGDKLIGVADKFVTTNEVIEEVRDPVSRQRLTMLPIDVDIMEPDAEFIKIVVKFAKETGDLQTLSDVDLKIIALSYMLESQIHGADHLRKSPPPLNLINVKKFPEPQLPGWGDNVPNLAEWDALEQMSECGVGEESKILPLKDLNNNIIDSSIMDGDTQDNNDQIANNTRRFNFPKKEIKIDEKKMVVEGTDASKGEDTENTNDWMPAVSRSTHRRYIKRQARRELANSVETDNSVAEDDNLVYQNLKDHQITSALEHLSLSHEVSEPTMEGKEYKIDEININAFQDTDEDAKSFDDVEISSEKDDSVNVSVVDDASSEQSWMLRSLSESSVACVTSDYAMQNVILQIGLRLLAPGGMQIRQLHRWVLKCHACNKVTQEIGRIFCPKCGNGGTMRKVSVTVGENGVTVAARRQRNFLRGTKFSLPMPQGGRDAITKNLILREDQLPHKLLYPKTKKKSVNKDDFLGSEDIFTHTGEKKAPLKPPVRKAMALFSGRRNPNDNHYSRAKH